MRPVGVEAEDVDDVESERAKDQTSWQSVASGSCRIKSRKRNYNASESGGSEDGQRWAGTAAAVRPGSVQVQVALLSCRVCGQQGSQRYMAPVKR
jgi:hypothetical protein